MYARYNSHHDATLSYMEDAIHHFHTFKNVFSLRRARNKVKAKTIALKTELVKKQQVDEDTNADTWMLCQKRHKMSAWQVYIEQKIEVSKEWDADINIPKIHIMFHSVEQIRRDGALQQYSASRHEHALKTNLKYCWNTSNHNLHFLPEVIIFLPYIVCVEIRNLNL